MIITFNWLSKDLSDYNLAYWSDILTEKYVKAFNDDVDKDGLEGLHVGLKKNWRRSFEFGWQ